MRRQRMLFWAIVFTAAGIAVLSQTVRCEGVDRKELVALGALHAVDALTTQIALSQGGREGNPLLPQSPAGNLAVKAAYTTGLLWTLAHLPPKAAKILTWVDIGVEGAVVGSNIRVIVRLK